MYSIGISGLMAFPVHWHLQQLLERQSAKRLTIEQLSVNTLWYMGGRQEALHSFPGQKTRHEDRRVNWTVWGILITSNVTKMNLWDIRNELSTKKKRNEYLKTWACNCALLLFVPLWNLKCEQSVSVAGVQIDRFRIAVLVIPYHGCRVFWRQ